MGVVWGCGSFIPGCAADLADGPFRRRFGHRPPQAAFELAFRQAPPADVSDLRAAGEAWLAGTNVWLRFRASEPTVRRLLADYQRGTSGASDLTEFRQQWDASLQRHDPHNRLEWDELYRVRQPENFTRITGDGHFTNAWVDRQKGIVYVFVFGI
jgi:hypothetical protein